MPTSRSPAARVSVLAAVAMALVCTAVRPVAAQGDASTGYPKQSIRIVLGFGAGGSNDIIARIIAQKLSERLGQPVVVENRTGANGNIAAEAVKNAAPDGYTLLSSPTGVLIHNVVMYKALPYQPLKDFAPISIVADYPFYLTISAELPVKSVTALIAYAKAHPDKANYGSTGGSFRLLSELFNQRTGSKFEHIPYRSTAELTTALLTGQTMMSFIDPTPLGPLVRAGKLRLIGVTSARRSPDFPETPTMAEQGYTGLEAQAFAALVAPAATPAAIVARLQSEIAVIVKLPDVSERLHQLGASPVGNSSAEFSAFVAAEIPRWGEVMKKAGIEPE